MATLIGTSGNNTLNGTSTSDTMFGQGGNDLLSGSGGNDRLNGGVGNDTLNGGADEDTADYSTGNFNGFNFQGALAGVGVQVNLSLTGAQNTVGAGSDTLISIENLIGTNFNDTLTGNSANNGLMGGSGNDSLNGGSGDDWLVGGTGNDRLNGGAGIDSADYRNKIAAIGATAGVTVNLNLTGAQNTGGAGLDTLVSIENINGTNFTDILAGNGANNMLSGEDGNDTLKGGNGNDTLYGGNGNDQLFGESGNDWLRGGNGNDLLNGGAGSDTADYATATAGVTVVLDEGNSIQPTSGGAGSDQLLSIESVTGSNFNDLISSEFVEDDSIFNGGNGNDNIAVGHSVGAILNGGSGNDWLFMGNGFGTLNGGTGDDHLTDTDGGSVLNGGDGNDVLEAFPGMFPDAILNGGAGADTLTGGGIVNTFDYNLVSDSPAGLGRDKILGFDGTTADNGEGDQIDLTTIDANSLLAGNQAFIWGGSFTAGHLRYVGGVIQGNTDADAAAEFEIQLVGAPTLVVGGANTDILL